jgi:hypothetical protein
MIETPIASRRPPVWPMFSIAAWLATISTGMWTLMVYAGTPGDPGEPPVTWPEDSTIPPPSDRPVLLLLGHPRCPCTRATLDELARLLARCRDRVRAQVLFLAPAGLPADWWKTDLWESASSIPGVEVSVDADGAEARRFRVVTSGHVLLYGSNGTLLFSGGITQSRGHEGANAGLEELRLAIEEGEAVTKRSSVFGCALVAPLAGRSGGSLPWKP